MTKDRARKVKFVTSTSILGENIFTFSIKKKFLSGLVIFCNLWKMQTITVLLFRSIFGFVKAPGVPKAKIIIWALVVIAAKNKSKPNPRTESHRGCLKVNLKNPYKMDYSVCVRATWPGA